MITANLRGNTITLRQVLLQRIVYEELKMVQTRVLQTWTYNTGPPLTHLFFSLHKVQKFLLLGKLHFSFQNLTPSVWHIPTAWRARSRTWLVKRRHWCHRSVPDATVVKNRYALNAAWTLDKTRTKVGASKCSITKHELVPVTSSRRITRTVPVYTPAAFLLRATYKIFYI